MGGCQIQWNSVITNSVANEHSVITNRFIGQIGQSSTQIDPVITNPGYNEQLNCRSRALRYNRVWLYIRSNEIIFLSIQYDMMQWWKVTTFRFSLSRIALSVPWRLLLRSFHKNFIFFPSQSLASFWTRYTVLREIFYPLSP